MEKVIKIGNKDVKLKSTAKTLRLYRNTFERDLLIDMHTLTKRVAKNKDISNEDLEIFECVIFVMASQADENTPKNIGDWLDTFEPMDIYKACPAILAMWNTGNKTLETPKKKQPAVKE